MGKPASIKDEAVFAGTSIATVSRILNDTGYPVSQSLRLRVENAIRSLGYRPNRMAQNLRSKQAMTIGLVIRDIEDSCFGAIAQGATEEASRRGLIPLVCSSKRDPKLELEYLHHLAQHQVAGIVLAGAGWEDEAYRTRLAQAVESLSIQGIRVVSCAPQTATMPCALVDNFALGKDAFHVLYDQGHRYFGLLCGDAANLSIQQRIGGFVEEARNAGAVFVSAEGAVSWQHGYTAAKDLVKAHPEITALFASTDTIAVGALRCLEEMRRNVPDDISVLGVGDIAVTQYTSPTLSTFNIPFNELGVAGVRLIFGQNTTPETIVYLPYSYVSRESVGPRR